MTIVILREGKNIRRGEYHVKMKMEIELMCLCVKEYQRLMGAKLGKARKNSSKPSQEHDLSNTLVSDFKSPNCEKINFCCLKPLSLWLPYIRPQIPIQQIIPNYGLLTLPNAHQLNYCFYILH